MFDFIERYVPHELISADQFDRARDFARGLPALWHWGILEARLADGDLDVDLLGALAQEEVSRIRMRNALERTSQSALRGSEDVLRKWMADDGSRLSKTPNLWLEWDRDGRDRPALPWICLAPDFFNRGAAPLSPMQLGEMVQEFFDSDPDLPVQGAVDAVVHLASHLPKGGKLMGFASLRPRGHDVCRVFVQLPRGSTAAWLRVVGWKGDAEFLASTRSVFEVEGEAEWCQIEFDRRIGPYLALELAQTERAFNGLPARERFLREVTRRGLATEERARAVLTWQGRNSLRLPSGRPVFLQRTFHLKLASAGEGTPIAKAYLGFSCHKAALNERTWPRRPKGGDLVHNARNLRGFAEAEGL